jgi:hypothetical protein
VAVTPEPLLTALHTELLTSVKSPRGATQISTSCSSRNAGLPLSVTRKIILRVPTEEGVQENKPVFGLMVAPLGKGLPSDAGCRL